MGVHAVGVQLWGVQSWGYSRGDAAARCAAGRALLQLFDFSSGACKCGGAAVEGCSREVCNCGEVKFTNPTVVQFQQRGVQMWMVQPWGRSCEVCIGA